MRRARALLAYLPRSLRRVTSHPCGIEREVRMLDKCEECGRAYNKRGDATVCEYCPDTLPVYATAVEPGSQWQYLGTNNAVTVEGVSTIGPNNVVHYKGPAWTHGTW